MMCKLCKPIFLFFMVALAAACSTNSTKKSNSVDTSTTESTTGLADTVITDVNGIYVTADYEKRKEGYDWVSVAVSDLGEGKLKIKVRSRADRKKQTCTVDAEAERSNGSIYLCKLEFGMAKLSFADGLLKIDPVTDKDETALSYPCSGGGSLKGTYQKIKGELDNPS